MNTTCPGVGADHAIAALHQAIGQVTSSWAGIEDGMFELFVIALRGAWLGRDIRPYAEAYFAFGAFEPKLKLVDAPLKQRFDDPEILAAWRALKKRLREAAQDRNEVAHLVAVVKGTPDPEEPAQARLVPPFWKDFRASTADAEFSARGLSAEDIGIRKRKWDTLASDVSQFARAIDSVPDVEGE